MRGFIRNRILLLVLVTLALVTLLLFSSIPGSPLQQLSTPATLVLQPVRDAIASAWSSVAGLSRSVFDAEAIRRENADLLLRIASLESDVQRLEEAGRQWERLKEAFAIQETFADYTIVGCRVASRAAGSWFDLFRVDAGERDGIAVTETTSYPVVDSSMDLVGRIYATDLSSARVLPILHEGSVVDGRIDRPGSYPVRVRGDLALREKGLCRIDRIPEGAVLEPGDRILTSGEGGLYPAGIPIGTVVEVSYVGTERTATLRPYASFDSLDWLFILKAKAS